MKLRLFDGHCDSAFELWYRAEGLKRNTCHIDLEKASPLRVYAQVFAFCSYAGLTQQLPCTQEELLTLPLQKLRREIAANSDAIAFAATRAQVESCAAQGKVAALLSLEGPEVIGCDAARLPALRREGFVMTTLTWNADNDLAGWHGSDRRLTPRGREFVETAQQEGILLDVSHLSERSFWDLMELTQKPVLASHSNCRVLCNHTRNLTDDQLRALAQTGGTVGLNLYPPFLGEDADYFTLLSHLEHALTMCGDAHVALGGDLDGCEALAAGFSGVGSYADFYFWLRERGYDEALLDRIFFSNLLRLLA